MNRKPKRSFRKKYRICEVCGSINRHSYPVCGHSTGIEINNEIAKVLVAIKNDKERLLTYLRVVDKGHIDVGVLKSKLKCVCKKHHIY